MATMVELSTFPEGTFIAVRSASIDTVEPVFDGEDFSYSLVTLTNGRTLKVNQVWEQVEDAMAAEGFSKRAPGLSEIFG